MMKLPGIITMLAVIVIAGGLWAAISIGNSSDESKTNTPSETESQKTQPSGVSTSAITNAESAAEAFDIFLQAEDQAFLIEDDELSAISNDDDILGSIEQTYEIE